MFPLYDDNSDSHTAPLVNILLIAANVIVFVLLQGLGSNDAFTYAFATVPKEILSGQDISGNIALASAAGAQAAHIHLEPTPVPVYLKLLTAMFMHGGFAHLGGNMLYLWIFGDNLENEMGHFKYLCFYLICGIAAGLAHVYTCAAGDSSQLVIPCLGASGAISGVLGGYVLRYPNRRVTVLLFRQVMHVPALVALGSWIFFQVLESSGLLGSEGASGGGVAYAAHIGGFIAGIVLVNLFAGTSRPRSYFS